MNPDRRSLLRLAGAFATAPLAAGCARRNVIGHRRTVATLWYGYGGRVRQTLLGLVDRFNGHQSEYEIRATYQGDYFELLAKLRTAAAAGVAPTFTHVVSEVVPYLSCAEVLEPLERYPEAVTIDFVPALSQAGTYLGGGDHRLVAVPFNRSTPLMYVNRDALSARGIAVPQSWSDLRAAALALTERRQSGTRWGLQIPISWWFWAAMVEQAGGSVCSASGDITLGGDAAVRALEFWQCLVHTDGSMRTPPGRDYDAWQATHQDFLAGRVAMIWTSSAFLRYLEDNANFGVVAAPLPRDVRAAVPTGGTFFVLLRAAPREEKNAAWAFVRWMCESEQTQWWATRTGYLPVTNAAVRALEDAGYYRDHPNDRVAYTQLRSAMPWPWSTELFRLQRDVIEPRLEAAVIERSDPVRVMADVRAAARES